MKNTSKSLKRLLSMVMVLAMILSMLPMTALAADTAITLYLKPNANWKQSNARFAVYTWDGGDQWFDMTDSNGDGIYEVTLPAGIVNIIFCRMNPSTTANNWNNRWNQTADLKVPTDGTNCYTVKEGTWDKGGGTWSHIHTYTSVVTEPNCTEGGYTTYTCALAATAIPAMRPLLQVIAGAMVFAVFAAKPVSTAIPIMLAQFAAWQSICI